ncbi:dipeptidyl aminopeptidase [Rhodoferax fermentans]|uniref:Dipeptidyl aminopeptidase n=1 Tax=Rhodoferax fermentans TaxID=28066 RepID=A0A1T1B487_RHOFE|nr:dipeptidyl aminopeptidase [Rhodoferax fermentans]OOV11098.1 dipeptidyl aminopeptidase [Rhodoferax fermentans]
MVIWLFLLAGVALVVVLRQVVHRAILRSLRAPRVAHLRTPADLGFQAHALRLPVAHGKSLFAWFVPVPGARQAPAVLLMHGWGANASLMLPALAPLHAAGYSVMLLDARCHGNSDDEAFTSLPRFAQDIEAGLDWLRWQPEVDDQRLVVLGHSVGAGAALLCATHRQDVKAVVCLGAFAHPQEVMRRWLAEVHLPYLVIGWYLLRHVQHVIGARFDEIAPIHSMARVHCPVLLVHGSEDEVVPVGDAQRLQAAGRPGQVTWIEIPGGHDPSEAAPAYVPQLIHFLQQALATPARQPVAGAAN